MEYRIHIPCVKSADLGATSTLASVACDRLATLEKVLISARGTQAFHAVNYSQIAVKNGSKTMAVRIFNSQGIAALQQESLDVSNADVDATTVLNIEYDFAASGLAVDCDLVLVFSTARSY
jgi:hypothetical protein